MTEQKKSNTPMILGIIGFVAMIPGLICATACGAIIEATAVAGESGGIGNYIIALTAVPTLAGFIFCFLAKSKAVLSGIIMVASSVIVLVPVIISGNWIFGLITVACYLIGGILAFQNR